MLRKTFQHHSKTIHDDMYGSHPSGCMKGNRAGVQKSERTREKASIFCLIIKYTWISECLSMWCVFFSFNDIDTM